MQLPPRAVSPTQEREHEQALPRSLYDRLGGIFAIAAVVDDFSDHVILNPVAGVNSENKFLRDWSRNERKKRLPGLKFMRTLWLAAVAGGPYAYSPTRPGKCPFSLENAHAGLQISPREFDAVALELAASLDRFKVTPREKNEVLAAFAAHKGEVNRDYVQSQGLVPPPIRCPFPHT